MSMPYSVKDSLIGGGIGAAAGLLLGGPSLAIAGGLAGGIGGGLLGGRKNPNPHIPEEINGQPTPDDLYEMLALLPEDDYWYEYLQNEDALPPAIFFPPSERYISNVLNDYGNDHTLMQVSELLSDYTFKLKHLRMIVYILTQIENKYPSYLQSDAVYAICNYIKLHATSEYIDYLLIINAFMRNEFIPKLGMLMERM